MAAWHIPTVPLPSVSPSLTQQTLLVDEGCEAPCHAIRTEPLDILETMGKGHKRLIDRSDQPDRLCYMTPTSPLGLYPQRRQIHHA
jgi:hypothetical protein